MVGLPYGKRTAKTDTGKKVEIANTLRLQRHSEIVFMYGKYLEETRQTDMSMSASTYRRILDKCSATRRKTLNCVDYFVGEGIDVR